MNLYDQDEDHIPHLSNAIHQVTLADENARKAGLDRGSLLHLEVQIAQTDALVALAIAVRELVDVLKDGRRGDDVPSDLRGPLREDPCRVRH